MSQIELIEGQSLSVAVMLATDNYNYNPNPKAISATTVMKPLRMLQLQQLKGNDKRVLNIQHLVASRTGSVVHTMLEESWLNEVNRALALAKLGKGDLEIIVNPTKTQQKAASQSTITVWVEQYAEKKLSLNILTGTFDFVANGLLEDLKNTNAFKVVKTMKEIPKFNNLIEALPEAKLTIKEYYNLLEAIRKTCPTVFDYSIQGSLYKYLNPDKIKNDSMLIQFIIKDYAAKTAEKDLTYPQTNPYQQEIPLFNHEEVEGWLMYKLSLLNTASMENLAVCDEAELWRDPTVWKVYASTKSTRCMNGGTFDSMTRAEMFKRGKKPGAVVKKIASYPKRCMYCGVRNSCTQADKMGVKLNEIKE